MSDASKSGPTGGSAPSHHISGAMQDNQWNAHNAQTRSWNLVLLSVAVILYLTLAILSIVYYGRLEATGSQSLWKYTLLVFFVLSFCTYMVYYQRKLHSFAEILSREQETARGLSRNLETLSSLLEVSSSINSQKNLSEILDTITGQMLTCFHADRSSIMLVDDSSQTLRTHACSGENSAITKEAVIPVGQGVSGWVAAHGQPLLLNGKVDDSRFPGAIKKASLISSSLCVPLMLAQKCIGVLNVNIMDSTRTFSEKDLKLLDIFANNAAVAIHNSQLEEEKNQRVRLQTMLGQLHSPQVVQKLVERISEGASPTRVREKVELTILFSDIRGFSDMLNVVDPEQIMSFLDAFYSDMNTAVFDNEGSIDKFIGDEVMAFFGAPLPLENSAENGLNTALEMLEYFKKLRSRFIERNPQFGKLGLGIGVNHGEVVVGNVGSASRYEYTVIGTAVNLARRLCAHAEPDQILTTRNTLEKSGMTCPAEALHRITFKGIPDSVSVCRIYNFNGKAKVQES